MAATCLFSESMVRVSVHNWMQLGEALKYLMKRWPWIASHLPVVFTELNVGAMVLDGANEIQTQDGR